MVKMVNSMLHVFFFFVNHSFKKPGEYVEAHIIEIVSGTGRAQDPGGE